MGGKLKVKRLSPQARLPTRGSPGAAGWDLYAAREARVEPGQLAEVDTDLAFSFPPRCYGRIAARSGHAVRHRLGVGAGVVDRDYRGGVKILLVNHGDRPFVVSPGDRLAQIICERYEEAELEETDRLGETERGARGFGSSGM